MKWRPLRDRFLEKIRKTDICWEWTAGRSPDGYGQIGKTGLGMVHAHRVAYELFVGPIPVGMSVLHHCDNPGCVNPEHLFLGTQVDNIKDMDAKRRRVTLSGENHQNAKLTDAQVREIRSRYQPCSRVSGAGALARQYGLGKSEVWRIVTGQVWRGVL